MGKKKPKDDDISTPSSIFTTLFGGVPDETAVASSIFSESNPFKRKHEESEAGNETIANSKNSDPLDSDIAELKKRKKNRKEKSNLDSDFAEDEEATNKNPNLSSESNGASENEKGDKHGSNLDSKVDFNEEKKNPNSDIEEKEGSEKRKRKKRKRDDVEREYEEKKYVVKAEEEEEEKKEVVGKVVVGGKRKQSDKETEDMLVLSEEEGFDDESKLLRTVFVGNLPLKVKKKALMKEFSNFGEVESVRIRSVPILDTKTPRKGAILKKQINDNVDSVHAYIVFKSEQAAEASLTHNMTVVGGNHIRVDRACPPRKKLKGENAPLYDNRRTVFVGNLPFDVKDEEIYQLFCGLNNLESSVEAVRVIRHSHMRVGKGIAYVLFKTREAANLVVKKRNLKLRDRELRLSRAGQNSTPSKRKSAAPASASNSPAKKFSVDSKSPGSANRFNSKGAMSYQGLQASKSVVQKKIHSGSTGPVKMKSKTQKGEKPKVCLEKRPSVALRKARAKVLKDGIATKQAGRKRKLDSRTPESSQRKKKAKKFR